MSQGRFVIYDSIGFVSGVMTTSSNVIANVVVSGGSQGYFDVSNTSVEDQTYIDSYYVANATVSPALTIRPSEPAAPGYDFNPGTGVWDANITLARNIKMDTAREDKFITNSGIISCGFVVSSSSQTELMPCDTESVTEYNLALNHIVDKNDYTSNNSQLFESANAELVLFAPLEISGLVARVNDRIKYNSNVFNTLHTNINASTTPEQVANVTYTFNDFV